MDMVIHLLGTASPIFTLVWIAMTDGWQTAAVSATALVCSIGALTGVAFIRGW